MIPKLRFKGFSGEWNSHQLGDIASFQKGKGISKADIEAEGAYKCIRYGELYTEYNEVIDTVVSKTNQSITESVVSEKGDVLIPASGETAIDMATACSLQFDDIILGGDINVIRPAKKIYSELIAYSLSHSKRKQLARVAQGNSVVHIYGKHLSKLQIELPNTEEEMFAINKILKVVNTKINLLTKKKEALETYKKGLMQKVFSQELRFKRKDGTDYPEWESLSFLAVFDRVKRKNKNGLETVLTISAQLGLVDPTEYFSRDVSSSDKSNYTLLHRNEFAYNKSYSKGYPLGAIKRNTRYDVGVLSPLYICFACKYKAYIEYYEHYFESGIFNKQIYRIAQEGARNHGLLNVSVTEFFEDTILKHPSKEESLKISNTLTKFDALITSVSEKLGAAEQLKKGLLQQMFV